MWNSRHSVQSCVVCSGVDKFWEEVRQYFSDPNNLQPAGSMLLPGHYNLFLDIIQY